MPPRLAPVCLALLLIYPADSLSAAREAFALWQQTVAPSLLPFFALIPALTCPEAADCWARILRLPCQWLGVPSSLAGAVGIALSAGSPAGARALIRISAGQALPAAELFRTAMLISGVSPGFLVSGVGAGMLGNPSAGAVLLLAQLASLFTASLLLRPALRTREIIALPSAADQDEPGPILFAARSLLSILVWMTVFAAGTRIAGILLPQISPLLPYVAEFSSGCANAAALKMPLPVFGAIIGFGGLCVTGQNLAILRPIGIPARMYIAAKLIHASLCAIYTLMLQCVHLPAPSFTPECVLSLLIVACLLPLFHKIMTAARK